MFEESRFSSVTVRSTQGLYDRPKPIRRRELAQGLRGNVASPWGGQRFRRGQGKRGLVRRYPGRFQDEQGVPTRYRSVEPRRINLGQQKAERERVAEGKLADLARGDLGVQQVTVRDRALKAAVRCALASPCRQKSSSCTLLLRGSLSASEQHRLARQVAQPQEISGCAPMSEIGAFRWCVQRGSQQDSSA
jgi:hypothetical protein